MKFETNIQEHFTVLKVLEEKLDSQIAPFVKSEFVTLNTSGMNNIILNMEHVKFADSSGLSAILMANRLFSESGGILVLCHLNDHVMKTIEISRLHTVLNIIPTEAEATEAVYMAVLEAELEENQDENSSTTQS